MNGLMKFSVFCMLLTITCAASVPPTNFDFCEECISVVDTIKYYAEQNYTRQEIEALVLSACEYLGPGYSKICDFVGIYGVDMVIKLLAEMDPKSVCTKIWMCSERVGDAKCSLCKFVIDQIMYYVETGHTEEEVKKFITMLCNTAGTKYAPVCEKLLDMGWDELIEYLKTLTSDKLCQYMTLC